MSDQAKSLGEQARLVDLSILGTPSEKTPWMLQYGGHHLALNITIVGERGVLTPTLTGAQPATYTVNGKILEGKLERVQAAYQRGLRLLDLFHDSDASVPLGDLYTAPAHLGGAHRVWGKCDQGMQPPRYRRGP